MKNYLLLFFTGLFVLLNEECLFARPAGITKPNIIFVLADDLGYGDLSCYNTASKIYTPNLDKLAANGIRLTNAHSSSSICTPSRYSIITGRYSWRSKMKSGLLWSYDWPLIEDGRLTVAQFLKENGYSTGIIGKWHLGWKWPVKPGAELDTAEFGGRTQDACLAREQKIDINKPLKGGPLSSGFDYQFGVDIPSLPPFCFIEDGHIAGPPLTEVNRTDLSLYRGYVQQNWRSDEILPALMNKAMEFISKKSKSDKPFFLYLPVNAPHHPIAPSKPYIGKSKAGDYGDIVQELDDYMGKLIQLLKELKIDKNTLVIFTSDNGSQMDVGSGLKNPQWNIFGSGIKFYGHHSNGNLRGYKFQIWEGGHRVPFIASWPGVIPAGKTSDERISLTDFFATCAGIINKPLPTSCAEDSFNISPVLKGKKSNRPVRESIIFHSGDGVFAIEKDGWKYIASGGSGSWLKSPLIKDTVYTTPGQLYKISTDVNENTNVYAQYPAIVEKLSVLLKQQKKTGTRFLK